MDRDALRYALHGVARAAGLSLASALGLTAAIWIPTLAFRDLAGLSFFDAYMLGVPSGLSIVTFGAIGVLNYKRKARRS